MRHSIVPLAYRRSATRQEAEGTSLSALLDELGLRRGIRLVPVLEVTVELHADAGVSDRREPRDLDRVRPDLVGDVSAFSQERNEAGQVGRFLHSYPHGDPAYPMSADPRCGETCGRVIRGGDGHP